MALVIAAFLRPQLFHQLIFQQKYFDWQSIGNKRGKSNAEIFNQAHQAVVTVIATRAVRSNNYVPSSDWSIPQENNVQRGTGTGFIIDRAGLIVTNEHVIKEAERIRVKLADGRERKATVQGLDRATDLALLKIDAEDLRMLPLGDSDAVRVGDPVIAIGNPLEYEQTVTAGIVSAKGRKVYNEKPYEDFIQTDAAINRGNSGGPLLNQAGEVIGVNTVIRVDGRGISFAVPSNVVLRVVRQLRAYGFVARGFLGLTPADITSEIREGLGLGDVQGVLVADVTPKYPAERAGVLPYDVITHFDGRAIKRTDEFFRLVANSLPRQQVELAVMRGGKLYSFFATLEPRADDRPLETRPALQKTGLSLGFSVRENTPETLRDLRIDKLSEGISGGVVVSEVDPLSPAADSHLAVGQIILEANRQSINGLEDFQRVKSQLRTGGALVLRVTSPNRRDLRLVAIRIGEI
ncbi:MAG: trypsin-like peptidase domain-containing protein [Acidobacteria bacterium]|nr:trypsin-like peptidase domain-containing protein [Acidobacteriota bacterium]MCI0660235.1 trypsin-like peptidase domain-containing protein [Acidobacteriota bacterium]